MVEVERVEENQKLEVEENLTDLGKVEISPEVIEIIASMAASEVEGVANMYSGFATGVVGKISRKQYGKGVKVELTDDGILVDVQLQMKYGVSIPIVAQKVQDNILQTLKTMTALEVSSINIHVAGIVFDQPEKHKTEE